MGKSSADRTIDKLGPEDVTRCVQARHRLAVQHVRLLNILPESIVCPCQDKRTNCATGRRRLVNSVIEELDDCSLYHVLCPKDWEKIFTPVRGVADACDMCQKNMVGAFNEGRQSVFSALESYF